MSGRSMGMISSWNNDTYKTIEATVGNKKARMVAHAHTAATSWVEGVVKTEGIDCGFHRLPGYVFEAGRTGKSGNKAYEEFSACSRLGLMQAKMEHVGCGAGVTTGSLTQALTLPNCACLDPVKYTQGLAKAVVDAGGKVFEGTKARGGIVTGPHQGIVQIMDKSYTVQARDAVVLATHSPINRDQLWVHDRQLPRMSYTIGLEVPKGSVQLGQYFDLQGGHQMRLAPLPGNPDVEVLLVQAAMELYGSTGKEDPYAKLEAWARSIFPQAVKVVTKWSSHDYYPADLLGLYGQDPLDREQPANYIMTGHSGQDMTGATIGSEVVANSILQLPNPWAAAYKPSRFMLTISAAAKYAVELTTYFSRIALCLGKHIMPGSIYDIMGVVQPHSVEGLIKPGDGMVVQHGWRKKALWRDEEGTLHQHSALCTHLGCCVSYNPIEKCFDCPCHGSCFTGRGQCVHGPAVADLEDLMK
ncbi:hypothetical protein DUNSADRAFT_14269 [Dunaliella salina]|uniref:Rieske domain-containing protein n=1 Tax=Dunaliella salina TaxID=3046 RepID=A0ABQ7G7N7_DUNSA|nr:hypothetical protein DUNSADRAFT_14269 [Dunaliella salina]|eukprot:KAF5830603.1 hypothetical protein DUNSADRAFT_14269 [Dunaliella salina]